MRYCKEYAALLDLYVDGELETADMVRVQSHVDQCPACRAYVDDALAIRAAFPDVEDTVVPASFADDVMARIQADTVSKKKKKAPWAKALLPLAACCAIVILLQDSGIFSGRAEEAGTADCSTSESIMRDACETATESAAVPAEPTEEMQQAAYDVSAAALDEGSNELAEVKKGPDSSRASGNVYTATLYLSADCAELLTDYTPLEETSTNARYELTPAEYEILQSQLKSAKLSYMCEDGVTPTTDKILVILSK